MVKIIIKTISQGGATLLTGKTNVSYKVYNTALNNGAYVEREFTKHHELNAISYKSLDWGNISYWIVFPNNLNNLEGDFVQINSVKKLNDTDFEVDLVKLPVCVALLDKINGKSFSRPYKSGDVEINALNDGNLNFTPVVETQENELDKLTAELKVITEERDKLQIENDKLKEDLAQIIEENRKLKDDLDVMTKENTELKADLVDAKKQPEASVSPDAKKSDCSAIQTELDKSKADISKLIDTNAKLVAKLVA
jgi:regulator of replication initiation timing